MSSQQVTGKRMLQKYEVEYNGAVFNCLQCGKDNCCSVNADNSPNKVACQKCRCQQLYTVTDGTRAGSEPVGDMSCTNCTSNMSQAECASYEFLNNKVIQNVSVVDCSNKMITAGANNTISDVELTSTCNTGGPTQVNNLSNGSNQINPNYMMIGGIIGVFILLFILYSLFK
jgi:hypothetical protein